MNIFNKMIKFMYGRYGTDELNHFLLGLYVFSFFIQLFWRQNWIFLCEIILIFFIFFRTFSKNIKARRKEKQVYLNIKNQIRRPFEMIIKNRKDKNHIYKKCHHCKTVLRLPLPTKRGIKHTTCPNCKKKLTILALKYQKIEIITKKKA